MAGRPSRSRRRPGGRWAVANRRAGAGEATVQAQTVSWGLAPPPLFVPQTDGCRGQAARGRVGRGCRGGEIPRDRERHRRRTRG